MDAPRPGAVAAAARFLRSTLVDTYNAWRADRVVRLGAGLAYYGLFAIVPVLTLGVAIAGVVFDEAEVEEFLAERLGDLFGTDIDTTELVDELTATVGSGGTQLLLGLVSLVSLLFAASVVFIAFQDALNVIFHVPARRGIDVTLRRRLVAFGVVVLAGAVFVVSFAVQSVTGLLESLVPGNIAILDGAADLLGVATSAVLGMGVLALLLRILPGTKVAWRHALVGAVTAASFVALGSWLFGLYTSRVGVTSVGGAAGSVFMVLVFIYYVFQIILGGAVLTKVLHDRATSPTS